MHLYFCFIFYEQPYVTQTGVGARNEERKINKNTTKKRRLLCHKCEPSREKIMQSVRMRLCVCLCVWPRYKMFNAPFDFCIPFNGMFTQLYFQATIIISEFSSFNANFHIVLAAAEATTTTAAILFRISICWLTNDDYIVAVAGLFIAHFSRIRMAMAPKPNQYLYWNRNWYHIILSHEILKYKITITRKQHHTILVSFTTEEREKYAQSGLTFDAIVVIFILNQ